MAQQTQQAQGQGKKTVIERFLIGEELGRGAYGQVFKGMDSSSGDVVAIKQIGLGGVSSANLAGVMGEIDLLKTLNHKNIVKYVGSFKTRAHLYIILEYMENGALSSVIKPNRFGVFPETLVAIYIAQVLAGLAYLHDQGVVHRDIKGANILTTKDGLVKLADFGVAAKLGELEEQHCDELHQNVVGTPYWMAPEVIEMTQVTPASDIWSVGCLIIELLTGCPPYYDLQPMSALFRIVQDSHPPLPETVSPLLEDFLLKCFQKDPAARPDARSLLQHEWVQFNRRTLRGTWSKTQGFRSRAAAGAKAADAHENVNSVVARILQAEGSEDELIPARGSFEAQHGRASTAATSTGSSMGLQQPAPVRTIDASMGPLVSNTPARLALQQDALLTSSSQGSSAMQQQQQLANAPTLPSASGSLPSAEALQQQQQQQGRRAGSIELAQQHQNGAPSPAPSPRSRLGQQGYQQQQQEVVGAGQQQQQQQQCDNSGELGRPPSLIFQGEQLQYGPGGGSRFSPSRQQLQQQQLGGMSPPVEWPPHELDSPLGMLLARIQGDSFVAPGGGMGTPSSTAAAAAAQAAAGGQNLMAWLDDGPVGGARGSSSFNGLAGGSSRGQLLEGGGLFGGGLLPSASSASLDATSLQAGGLDGESSLLLEAKRKVRDLVRSLRPGPRDVGANMTPQQASLGLAALFNKQPDARQLFLSEGGVLAALELLDAEQARLAEAALDLLSAFTSSDTRLLESLCLVGLVPVVVRMAAAGGAISSSSSSSWQQQQQQPYGGGGYAAGGGGLPGGGGGSSMAAGGSGKDGPGGDGSPGFAGASAAAGGSSSLGALGLGGPPAHSGSSAELTRLRVKAAGFVAQLCFAKETTLQMLIACGGLRCLVVMVKDNLHDPSTLTLTAVACIWRVLETYGALPLNYICRIFASAGLITRLYAVVKQLVALSRQQQQRGGGVGYAGGGGSSSSHGQPKLHHLHSPSNPNVFGSNAFIPLGSIAIGQAAMSAAAAAATDSSDTAASIPGAKGGGSSKGAGGRGGSKGSPIVDSGLAGQDELQQQQHRRAASVDDKAAAAASGGALGGQQTRAEWLLEKSLDLLLVLAHADSVVKGLMCSKDNLQHLLDLTQRLGLPGLLKAMKTVRWLTSEPSVLPAIKDSGAISQLVPFLSREREAVHGQAVVLEALCALHNICKFNKRVHLEVAATGGIVPHLCRFASEHVAAHHQQAAATAAGISGSSGANGSSANLALAAAGDPLAEPGALSAAAAADARRAAVRTYVVPLLIGLATTSSSTRAKLWASNGLDIFLQLLCTEGPQMQVGLMRTLDIWLAEDHSRVENRLCQREAVGPLVEVYQRLCRNATSVRSPVMPQMLDSLKVMLGRSSKVAVALAAGGLVPPLLEPLTAGAMGGASASASAAAPQPGSPAAAAGGAGASAPILRAKLLEIIRIMYQHYPRPKEFIMKYRIQDVLLRLLENEGRGEDAVKVEAQKLLNAFHINVLL